MDLAIRPVKALRGQLRPPGDKSLTHRAYMLAAIAASPSRVRQPLVSEDCERTLRCLGSMGLQWDRVSNEEILLRPSPVWEQPEEELFCGNSGTTMRLLSGLVASRPVRAVLTGDESLSKRPMRRIAEPLKLMGAEVEGDTAPITIQGKDRLTGIDFRSAVASAQVKSCALFAGLRAEGTTTVREPSLSRDHTERMLAALGVDITQFQERGESVCSLHPGATIDGFEMEIPGDFSSAAYFLVAAAVVAGSSLEIFETGTNPTRCGLLEVFHQMGLEYELGNERQQLNEPIADIAISTPERLNPFRVEGALVPRLIDEIPILAVLASQCEGESVFKDAEELRVKESDRIELISRNLRAMGAESHTTPDGLRIVGPSKLRGTRIESGGDHRIAMAFAVAGLIAEGETNIGDAQTIATSYPDFESHLARISVV